MRKLFTQFFLYDRWFSQTILYIHKLSHITRILSLGSLWTNGKVYAYNNLREQILFIQIAKLKKFSTLKNSPCTLTQSIKVHRGALASSLPSSLPSLWKIRKESRNSHHFWSCNVTAYTREPTTRAWSRANIWRQDGAICSKNRKFVPFHGFARIPRLTVSVPDYGSWLY